MRAPRTAQGQHTVATRYNKWLPDRDRFLDIIVVSPHRPIFTMCAPPASHVSFAQLVHVSADNEQRRTQTFMSAQLGANSHSRPIFHH
jgi:hypothetical protein